MRGGCSIKYKTRPFVNASKKIYKSKQGDIWHYISADELPTQNNKTHCVFFDLCKHENSNAEHYLVGEKVDYGLVPYHERLSWTKRIIGYLPVIDENGKEGFIRILASSRLQLLLPIFGVFLCISLFLFGMWFAQKDDIPGLDRTAISYHIEGVENTNEESILLPGIKVINAKENDTYIEAVLMNPVGNGCYFKYTISLKDSGKILYTSGLIPPGKAVTEFEINEKLMAGSYPIKILVETQDLKDTDIVYNAGNIDAQLNVVK